MKSQSLYQTETLPFLHRTTRNGPITIGARHNSLTSRKTLIHYKEDITRFCNPSTLLGLLSHGNFMLSAVNDNNELLSFSLFPFSPPFFSFFFFFFFLFFFFFSFSFFFLSFLLLFIFFHFCFFHAVSNTLTMSKLDPVWHLCIFSLVVHFVYS